ncbi:MAG: tRNA uridine(34) 5-carboxymethylaminomethyl modification radical SAM/GNAT enzyme Elp3 [Xanthomonadaceae bacterium]|nr:tRNA uridine(34) 5-carboxymethylaminomethyl modification radical SAM/GNAT enzyme Elp3 [Rhodospirillaceae bacterium]NIA18035.1 tRNA uridine(34) 5-carboxymethylaminomethyl modification radical SAM/GNAT enzyme Elp3 [Xanthomonadaceae bacterium]
MTVKKIVKKIIKANPQNNEEFLRLKREFFYQKKLKQVSNAELLKLYNKLNNKQNNKIKEILKKRKIRTLSGVAPIAVLTKPYSCPGKCVYCPTEKNIPKSYLSNEPAVMRAVICNFNPYKQVSVRIKTLETNGHNVEKIELIVMGGTWSFFSKKYQYWFIKECFRAANNFQNQKSPPEADQPLPKKISKLKEQLFLEQKKNEKTKYRIVGLTLETRPDYINEKEIVNFRSLGCTRVEIGVQIIDNKILKLNKRGHNVESIIKATFLLRQAGFKICYHLMPSLPGATPAKDLAMFKKIFSNKNFQPDQIKIYPCVVVKNSQLYNWWKHKKYKPYTKKQLENLLIRMKKIVPYYVRIIRLIRDIPTTSIEAGNKISNLRQVLQKKLSEEGVACKCIRCREARNRKIEQNNLKLFIEKYQAGDGTEYFLSFESKDRKILFAFLRLRLPAFRHYEELATKQSHDLQKNFYNNFPELKNSVIVRELHTYGKIVSIKNNKDKSAVQHKGLGKRLMLKAEKIAQELKKSL